MTPERLRRRGRKRTANADGFIIDIINAHSTSSKNVPHRLIRLIKQCVAHPLCCFAIVVIFGGIVLPCLLSNQSTKTKTGTLDGKHRCWLRHALESGEFQLFSHRSYCDNAQSEQPTCRESLLQLLDVGVSRLDLDLVLDDRNATRPKLVVAHPMEYKRQSKYYSPCANIGLDEMISLLREVYDNDFFISMEPKAAWGNTPKELQDAALTNFPSAILTALLETIRSRDLGGKCAVIAEVREEGLDDDELEKERTLLAATREHCEFFRGIRLADAAPSVMGEYDAIMPTIEFHPNHARNTGGKVVPKSLQRRSIYWVVDDEDDLKLAASLRPRGIVSNTPKKMVQIIEDSKWCEE